MRLVLHVHKLKIKNHRKIFSVADVIHYISILSSEQRLENDERKIERIEN